jgi:hypothetical protein
MSWVGSACQGDRRYECTYADWYDFSIQWCRDSDDPCPSWDDGGALIAVKDNQAPSGGGW